MEIKAKYLATYFIPSVFNKAGARMCEFLITTK